MKKIKNLKNKKTNDLLSELKKNRQKLRTLNFDLVTRKLKNHQEVVYTKRKIAIILTILSKRRLEEMEKIAMVEENVDSKNIDSHG